MFAVGVRNFDDSGLKLRTKLVVIDVPGLLECFTLHRSPQPRHNVAKKPAGSPGAGLTTPGSRLPPVTTNTHARTHAHTHTRTRTVCVLPAYSCASSASVAPS
jgi:hypothetical protein